jgi:TPR repeat protein
VSRDYRQAADWFQKASEHHYALAQLNLGFLYQSGLGVRLNYSEAYMWFALAAKSRPDGRHALEALTQIMTKAQLRDGQTRLSAWASHHDLEVAAGKAEAIDPDSYAAAGQP